MIRTVFLAVSLAAAAPATAAANPADAPVVALVDAFNASRFAFDQAALAPLVAPDYIEISPIGDVDPRARMLGFYTADQRQPAPAVVTSERSVRITGPLAIVTERQSLGDRAVRVVYVARRDAGHWRLASVQYTPIRSPHPPAAHP